jgi:hypothetical protein
MPDTIATSLPGIRDRLDRTVSKDDSTWTMLSVSNLALFDGHGTLQPPPPAPPTLFGRGVEFDLAMYPKARLSGMLRTEHADFRSACEAVQLPVQVPLELCIRTHRYRLGADARLLAFERGVDYHMSEDLKQAGGNEPLEKSVTFTAKLSKKAHVYDLRTGAYLGERDDIAVDLNPWKPSLFALLGEKLPEGGGVVETLLSQASGSR